MTDLAQQKRTPLLAVNYVDKPLSEADFNDLCDCSDAAIRDGSGGLGWVELPDRAILERFWRGVITMPSRDLFVARLDNVICGGCQVIHPSPNNEAHAHAAELKGLFISPWARGHGLSRMLLDAAEDRARAEGRSVMNLGVRDTMDVAITLYESAGYKMIGHHDEYAFVHGEYVSGRYYTKRLA